MKKQSRFEEISRKRSERNIIFIIVGMILVFVLFFFYGIPLLINFSLLIQDFRNNTNTELPVNNSSYVAPPFLDPLEEATNSAQLTVSGSALPKQVIKLYVNGKYFNQTKVGEDKTFIFDNVTLKQGDNDIKAKSVISDKESGYSQTIHIAYKNKAPNLEIKAPGDGQTISSGDSQAKVEGKTDPSVRVTVNDYWAIVDNQGNFSYLLRLQKGENIIKVVASDNAGNKTSKEFKVTLNQ